MSVAPETLAALSAEEKRRLLTELLARRGAPAPPRERPERHALTAAQRRLWFIEQLSPGLAAYHIPAAIELAGALDSTALARALDAVIERHDVLRATFAAAGDGEPFMRFTPPAAAGLQVEDADAGSVDTALRALVAPPFDLAHGPLLRARLLRCSAERHVLLLCVHHLVADHASLRILLRDMAAAYAGTPLPPLQWQYADHAAEQLRREAEAPSTERDWWCAQLADPPPDLPLPADRPRPAQQRGRGARHLQTLPAPLAAALRTLARGAQASLFATLLAAWQALLARISGQDDVWVGTLAAQRDRPELRPLVGLFVNNLVLRTRVDAQASFLALLAAVRRTVLDALAHQSLPFEQLVQALGVQRRLDRHPLFQLSFVLHEGDAAPPGLPGLQLRALEADAGSARFDLALDINTDGEALQARWEYDADLFDAATIAGWAQLYDALLQAVVAQPQVPLATLTLMDGDAQRRIAAWNATAAPMPALDVPALFERQARATPDAPAIDGLSYAALHARVRAIAAHCTAQGLRAGDVLGLCLPRDADLPAALLACLHAGFTYLPLDPRQPPARRAALLQRAGAAAVLVHGPQADLPCAAIDLAAPIAPATLPAAACTPQALAYLIFTSGSTGEPKGVPVTRGALRNLLQAMAGRLQIGPGHTLLALTTVAFDIAALELLLPLLHGARIAIADTAADGAAIAARIEAERVTHLQATPAGWRLLLDAGWAGRDGLVMLCGGETLDLALARRLLTTGGRLWNLYGPTETTIWSAALELNPALLQGSGVPIGGPLANTTLEVVDEAGRPLPPGLAGELAIGGLGLSPGYWRAPQWTAARFFQAADGRRLYRSGDRVRRRDDGLFDFLGRNDQQIKLRGFRIEPGEIEAALAAHPAVAQSLVLLHTPAQGEPRLAAYVVPRTGRALDAGMLQTHLAPRLPAYMLPSAWALLDALPLNANGKIDRRALPPPDAAPAMAQVAEPPQGELEQALATLWTDLLGVPVQDRALNFFAAGGHSLLAARLIARLPQATGRQAPLRTLFEQPSLRDFAAALDAPADGALHIGRRPAGEAPLSAAQQRLWVLAQLEPDNPFYNIAAAVRLPSTLPLAELRAALAQRVAALLARHDNLRSRFPAVEGRATLVIEPALEVPIELLQADNAEQADALLREAARRPFDLARAPLWRVLLLPEPGDGQGHRVGVVLHHILADAWSLNLLVQALAEDAPSVPLPLQYADYAAWQRAQETGAALAWWRTQLRGAPPLLELPTDFARPATQRLDGASVRFHIDGRTRDALDALARAEGATLFMLLLAAWQWLLARYSGSDDVVVGTPVSHRPDPALDGVIGVFTNTLALRTRLGGCHRFIDVLARVRTTVLDAFAHQQVPFEQVVDALQLPRDWRHAPLFQALLLWQAAPPPDAAPRPWTALPLDLGSTRMDLTLALADRPDGSDGLGGRFDFRTDLFLPGSIEALAGAFGELLRQIAHAPRQPLERLALLPANQRQYIEAWNAPALQHDRRLTLPAMIHAQASRTPHAPALLCGDQSLTYAELMARAAALAQRLRAAGARPGTRVAVCLPRRAELVVALLAVLDSGAAYVPLDPAYPAERLALIAADAQAVALVALPGRGIAGLEGLTLLDPLAPAEPADVPACAAQAADLAYLIYTSGSTGRPKGVAIEHRQAVAMLQWAHQAFTPAQLAGVLAGTSVCFDLSVFEIFAPLSCGGCVVLAEDVLALPQLPSAPHVTLVNTVPTACAELLRLGPLPRGVRVVNLAGEPLPPELVQTLYREPGVEAVWNLYGPSEDTTYSTATALPRHIHSAVVSIGRVIPGSQAWVLDEALQPVPIGMPGELFLGGEGVARGYWKRPALTAERFVPDPWSNAGGARLYRTGDRVRQRCDGQLEFLGRLDQQVKIRGFRIELGEVEAALREHAAVRDAVASAQRDAGGHLRLVAHVGIEGDAPAGIATLLRRQLQQRLPAFMVPAAIVPLPALPRLPNGKLDRRALPPALFDADTSGAAQQAPQTPTETLLATHWAAVLGRAPAGREAGFFDNGGDSILAIQLVSRARETGLALTPRDVFLHPTLAALAAQADQRAAPAAVTQAPTLGEQPLTPAQRWFFALPLQHRQHWNQAVLLRLTSPPATERLAAAAAQLAAAHDMLRARFERDGDGRWHQIIAAELPAPAWRRVQRRVDSEPAARAAIEALADEAQRGFDLARGPLWLLLAMQIDHPHGSEHRLLVVAHHLVVDGVSWRVLLGDLQALAGGATALPPRGTPVFARAEQLQSLAAHFEAQRGYWLEQSAAPTLDWPADHPGGSNRMRDAATASRVLDAEATQQWLQQLPAATRWRHDELLLAALLIALRERGGPGARRVVLEGHGRGELPAAPAGLDLVRGIGWLTSMYPLRVDIGDGGLDAVMKQVRSAVQAVPDQGLGWAELRDRGALADVAPGLRLNYLGQTDALFGADAPFAPADERSGAARHGDDPRDVLLDFNAIVSRGRLQLHGGYSRGLHQAAGIDALMQAWEQALLALLRHGLSGRSDGAQVASDFPLMALDDGALDGLLDSL